MLFSLLSILRIKSINLNFVFIVFLPLLVMILDFSALWGSTISFHTNYFMNEQAVCLCVTNTVYTHRLKDGVAARSPSGHEMSAGQSRGPANIYRSWLNRRQRYIFFQCCCWWWWAFFSVGSEHRVRPLTALTHPLKYMYANSNKRSAPQFIVNIVLEVQGREWPTQVQFLRQCKQNPSIYFSPSFVSQKLIIKECAGRKEDELSPQTGGLHKPCEVASKHPIVFTAWAPSLLLWRDRERAETKQAATL